MCSSRTVKAVLIKPSGAQRTEFLASPHQLSGVRFVEAGSWLALSANRFRKGSDISRLCSQAICSPTLIPLVSSVSCPRMDRINSTASNDFLLLLIFHNLTRRSYLKHGIATADIDRVVTMNPVKVNNVSEVPAHEYISSLHRRHRYVLGVY